MSDPTTCEACGAAIAPTIRLCESCAKKAGLAGPPTSRRRLLPCAHCGHHILIRAQVRERTVVPNVDRNEPLAAPLAITYARGEEFKSLLSLKKIPSATPDVAAPFGILEAYVCRECGFVEWFAQAPEKIPIGATYGTELIDLREGAYR